MLTVNAGDALNVGSDGSSATLVDLLVTDDGAITVGPTTMTGAILTLNCGSQITAMAPAPATAC